MLSDAQTQIVFNPSNRKTFTFSFGSWSTDRKTIDAQLEYQVDIGSEQKINNPKYLIVAQQTAARIGVANKANNIAVFDNPKVRKYFVDIDGIGYPRDGVCISYASNDYLDQCRDPKLFCIEYVGKESLSPFINYTVMKLFYPI